MNSSKQSPLADVEVLKDSRLIVWSHKESRELYQKGYFGKPLGISKPKEDFEAPLILDPIEGVYLLEKKLINAYAGENREEIGFEKLVSFARDTLEGFDHKFQVYKDLRERGLVVTPGIKYGCDFAVYDRGPGIDHSPYIIKVQDSKDGITAAMIVEAGRLATSVRKTFIIAMVDDKKVRYLSFKWWKP